MNKSKIQKFAVDGHKLLYKQIAQRAYQYGIEEGNVGKADATEVRGRILSPLEKSQRAALIAEINANGYPQTIERVTYNRISSERSTVHSNIYFPDYVVVVDETLLSAVDVTAGLKKEGAIVINSSKSPAELRPLLKGYEGRVCTIDAGKISEEELGKNFPNTPMLAAIVRVSGVIGEEEFIKDMEGSFKHKFASKPQVIEGNMRALKRSLEEVQVG